MDGRQLIGSKVGASVGMDAAAGIPGVGGGKKSTTKYDTVVEERVSLMPV